MIRQYLGDKFTYLGAGKDRFTFLSPNKRFVLKFPKWDGGHYSNQTEASIWKEYKGKPDNRGAYYAPCRLMKNDILMMWAVSDLHGGTQACDIGRHHLGGKDAYDYECDDGTPKAEAQLPEWVASVDCCQVGYLRNGKLAIYDYGD